MVLSENGFKIILTTLTIYQYQMKMKNLRRGEKPVATCE
jgi:hypothetical protein